VANLVEQITLGIDVSKKTLESRRWEDNSSLTVANEREPLRTWLKSWQGRGIVRIALEPTSTYHRLLVEEALCLGYEVYPVNARALVHYRKSIGQRNKTDLTDAYVLARFLAKEGSELRQYRKRDERAEELAALIHRRAGVVEDRKRLEQRMKGLDVSTREVTRAIAKLIADIDRRMRQLIDELGWGEDYRLCLSIPGIGPVTATYLLIAYNRSICANGNQFIAFLGLDVRQRQSGRYVGHRKLSKLGDPETRRALYCATQAACCYAPFERYRQAQLAKGLAKTEAKVILARKLARIAFALLRDKTTFIRADMAAAA
jgi:transposase